jgi:hypothetical protein
VSGHGSPSNPHQLGVALKQIGPRKRSLLSSPAIVNNQRRLPIQPNQRLALAATPRQTRPFPNHRLSHPIERAMSVKFEKETIQSTTGAMADAMSKGKDDLVHEIGQALTKGGGPSGYLAVSVCAVVECAHQTTD